jgi:hypothetical protein
VQRKKKKTGGALIVRNKKSIARKGAHVNGTEHIARAGKIKAIT